MRTFKYLSLSLAFFMVSNVFALGVYQERYTYPDTPVVRYATTSQFLIEKGGFSYGCRSLMGGRPSPPAPVRESRMNVNLSSLIVKSFIAKVLSRYEGHKEKTKKAKNGKGVSMKEVAVVHYPIDVYTLTDKQESELIGELQKYKNRLLYVEGFTDCSGTRAYNNELANERAKSVAGFLKKHGFRVKTLPSWGKYQTLKTDEASRRTVVYVAEINKN